MKNLFFSCALILISSTLSFAANQPDAGETKDSSNDVATLKMKIEEHKAKLQGLELAGPPNGRLNEAGLMSLKDHDILYKAGDNLNR